MVCLIAHTSQMVEMRFQCPSGYRKSKTLFTYSPSSLTNGLYKIMKNANHTSPTNNSRLNLSKWCSARGTGRLAL